MPCFYLTPKQDDFNQELQVCIAAASAYRAKLIELTLVGNYRGTMSDLTLKALWAALFVLAVLGAVFLESLPARATPADEHEVDKGAVILTDVIKHIRPKRSGGYELIPRSAYIENHGEIIPVLLNSGPSEFRIILTVLTWEDVTTQVNGEPAHMRVYYDKVPRSSLPELHNR